MTRLALRARQLPRLARRAFLHPRWFVESVRLARLRTEQLRRGPARDAGAPFRAEVPDAVAAATGASPEEVEAALHDVWRPQRAERHALGGRDLLLDLVGALVRLLRPTTVVEAGVAEGLTTAVALRALSETSGGRLYSVDLPPLEADESFVGRAVPAELRASWTLTLGPTRLVLPTLLERVSPVDLFVHDADHTYTAQLEDYRLLWPHLRSGGVLLSDDLASPAFVEFAASVGARPYLVGDVGDVGLLRKP